MEKIYYTSCAKSVFSREAGRQIYTCSRGLNFQVRQIADNYIKMLVMSASSQVRNVYTKHDDLGYVYAQIKAGGSDAAGRQNNEFCQLIFDRGLPSAKDFIASSGNGFLALVLKSNNAPIPNS